jgi:hypothetical protein
MLQHLSDLVPFCTSKNETSRPFGKKLKTQIFTKTLEPIKKPESLGAKPKS